MRKTPGGTTKRVYLKKKVGKPSCGSCGKHLKGMAHGRKAQLRNMPRSQRKVNRPYGGNLCSPCTRKQITQQVMG
jgi:large subunit ribosomal protein L34e